jgi:hypothetical protein
VLLKRFGLDARGELEEQQAVLMTQSSWTILDTVAKVEPARSRKQMMSQQRRAMRRWRRRR